MEFQPYFDDSQFETLTKDSKSEYDAEEEQEYDAINEETFGATVNNTDENDLEEFANRTADLILDDPSCSINAPDPSQIPLPQVNSVFCKSNYEGSYDKIWNNTAFNGIQSQASEFSSHLTYSSLDLTPSPLNVLNNQRNKYSSPDLSNAKTLEEIERDALFSLALPHNLSNLAFDHEIPSAKPGEPLNLEELEKRMLLEAALASGVMPSGAPAPNAITQAMNQLKGQPLPPPMPWLCGPPPMSGQFPSGIHTSLPFPFLDQQGKPMGPPPPGMFPPHFLGPDGMPKFPPMYNPFQGPPPPFLPPNARSELIKNFTNNKHQKQHNQGLNTRAVRSIPVSGSWMPVQQHNRQHNNYSPFQVNSVAQCSFSRNPPSVQGSTASTSNNRQRQKGLPSGKTISDFAFDPYAGFMSKKEREWLIKIHLIQSMGGGEPMEDDFYYIMWKKRNVLAKAPEEWKVKLQPKYYNFDDTYPSAAYIQPSFSGSLGRPTHCTANFPRHMIDLFLDNGEEEDLTSTKNTQRKLKAMLMRIENAALVLLKCEDLKQRLAAGVLDKEQEMSVKATLQDQMDLLISCTCTKDKLPTIMLIQKGRMLVFRTMAGVLQQAHLFNILKVLIETMPKYAKKIPGPSVTDCIKHISGFVSLLSKDQFVELVNLVVAEKELVNTSKFFQLTLFAFLVGLSKHEVNVCAVSSSSLHRWLNEEASECVLLKEIEKLFAAEDLLLLTKWLFAQDVVKPTNCSRKIVDCLQGMTSNRSA